jgi:diguanylate cyclase (GGDEF)-like protein
MDEMHIRVLLVEDNAGDADLLQEVLAEAHTAAFDVVRVEQLAQALSCLHQEHFDVVLLDLSLPDSQGLETFLRLHEGEPNVPILVVTGFQNDQLPTQAIRQGAQDYLVKGKVNGEALARSITYAIERQRLLEEVNTCSMIDELTGLYNRRGLQAVAAPLCKTVDRLKNGVALLFIDLDNLKGINDTIGHKEGDRALRETADVLKETFRESDVLARLGGDEFVVLAIGASAASLPLLEERLRATVRAHNAQEGRVYHLSLSVGVAHYDPKRPRSFKELLNQADALMYEQKRAKRLSQAFGPDRAADEAGSSSGNVSPFPDGCLFP